MAAEVSADLALINDEDILRRMWADTEDFGRKKEIRARMYKLREQRLKDFYTTGEVVTEVTGRKHLAKTHADSISDQGFITMKTKEIRDSESPTRDFSQRVVEQGNGYWNSRQENTYASGTDDGAVIQMKSNVTEGQGLIREGNTETQMAMAAHNLHESTSKTDENMSAKSERLSHASKMVSSSKTDSGDSSTTEQKSAHEQSSQMKSEQTSTSTSSSTTKWSTSSSSSRKVVTSSSSSSQKYKVTSGQELQSLHDVDDRQYRALTSNDEDNVNKRYVDTNKDISKVNDSNTNQENYTTRIKNTSNTSSSTTYNLRDNTHETTSRVIEKNVDVNNDQFTRTNDVNIQHTKMSNDKRQIEQNDRIYESRDSKDERQANETYSQHVTRDVQVHEDVVDRSATNTDTRRFITNERQDTQDIRSTEDNRINENVDDTRINRETRVQKSDIDDVRQSTRIERNNRTDVESNSTVTDQKIMKEIHKLDSYLSSQSTPAHSTPVSPHGVTDGANWTVVSNKDGEFIYQGEKPAPTQPGPTQPYSPHAEPAYQSPTQPAPVQQESTPRGSQVHRIPTPTHPSPPTPTQVAADYPTPHESVPVYPSSTQESPRYPSPTETTPKEPSYSSQPREKIVKHPSSIDLPKEPTDGQYVTTYQQSYNRISVDNSPSHEFFASTLRASPDRSTPSPTKRAPSRGSLDRSSPERRLRATSKGSLDRSSPESKPRSTSKSSLDRSSPERKYRPSSTKISDRVSPERKYRPSPTKSFDRESPERRQRPSPTKSFDRESPERRQRLSPTKSFDRKSPERRQRPSPTKAFDRPSPERKQRPSPTKPTDRSSPERKHRISPTKTSDRESPERRHMTSPTKPSDRESPERRPRPSPTKTSDRESPERKYRPTPTVTKIPDRERRVSAGSYTIEKSKDSRRKSTDTTRGSTIKETTTKTKRKFSSTQTKTANKTRVSTPGASPSTSPTRKYQPKDTTTTTDSDSDVSHGTYKKSTTATSQDKTVREQENTTITTCEDTIVDTEVKSVTNRDIYPSKTTPRDKSPEYSSEGSVSREIRENRIRDQIHETSPERRAFAPIKPSRPTSNKVDETVNLISNERQIVTDETDETVEVTEEEDLVQTIPAMRKPERPEDRPETNRLPRFSSTEEIITEIDSNTLTKRGNVKITDTTTIETVKRRSPYSSTEQIKEKSPSPDRKDKVKKDFEPGTRSSTSSSPERTPNKQHQPLRTGKTVTTHKETKTFITEERRRSIPEKVPEPRKPIETRRRTSKEVIEQTKKTVPVNRPEPTQEKARPESPRKKVISPSSSPERRSPTRPRDTSPHSASVSPERPSTNRRPQTISPQKPKSNESPRTVIKQTETDTHKTTRKIVSTETNRSPRKSNIPRSEPRPVPKNQTSPKERPESTGRIPYSNRRPQTTTYTSPQKVRAPLTERTVVTVTKTTTVTERKPLNKPKDSPVKPLNGTIRKIPTSPKKPASPATTPKTSPTNRKENIPLQKRPKETTTTATKITRDIRNRTSNQKENKRPTRPITETVPGKYTTTHVKDTRNVTTKKTQEVTDFLDHEKVRDTSDLEDESPPEEFYADIDEDTQTTVQTEQLQKTQNIRQTTSKLIKVEPIKPTKQIKDKSPSVPAKQTPQKPSSKPKQVLKESSLINETTKVTLHDTQRKIPLDSEVLTSSDEEEIEEVTEQVIVDEHSTTKNLKEEKQSIIKRSDQDLLTVIIQHPKSSRESSPGYPSGGVPFCSTSEDGESNPRYADIISEPEEGESFDKKRSVFEPSPYTEQKTVQITDVDDEDTEIRTSVAERVTEFLEAAKQTRETQEIQTQQVQVDSKKSVLKAKALFENIAKNQTSVHVSTKPVNIYETQPDCSAKSTQKPRETEPVKTEQRPRQPAKEVSDLPQTTTDNLIPTDEVPSDEEILPYEPAEKPKLFPKSYDSVNLEQQVNYEEEIYEEQDVRETTRTKVSTPHTQQTPVKRSKEPITAPEKKEPKKPLDRKPSGPTVSISSKKDFFERKAQSVDKPKTTSPKESVPRSRIKTQKEIPRDNKGGLPDSDTEESSVTAKTHVTERNESYLRSTVASTVRSQTPEKQPKDRRDSKPDVEKLPTRSSDHERSPTRQIDNIRKTSKPEEVIRKTSKPEEIIRRPSKPEDSPRRVSKEEQPTSQQTKARERSKSPLKSDERMKSPSKVIEATKAVQKIVEVTKKPLKEEVTTRRPSKPDIIDETTTTVKGKDINTLFKQSEQTVEVHKEGKFGVTLRKTPSSTKVTTVTTTKTVTPKKPTAPGDMPEVEDIVDLEILEELLLRAVGYDERRRIRAQIRIVKKQLEEVYNTPGKSRTTTTTTTTYTTIPSVKDIKAQSPKLKPEQTPSGYGVERTTKITTDETTKTREPRLSPERQLSRSPERRTPERKTVESRKSETKVETVKTYRKETSPKRESPERRIDRGISPEKQQIPQKLTERKSPDRKPIIKQESKVKQSTEKTTERKISSDRKTRPDTENTIVTRSDKSQQLISRESRSETNYETTTSVKSQSYRQVTSTSETKETCPTDSITSSYGVGPTDENGRPLFGLRALRRTNTNKTLETGENDLEEQITVIEDETEEVYDSKGRPLFGLKALQATTEEDTMPAQTAQLRELVEKHQQYARESSAKEIKPVQKPKAKLRDSFILSADDDQSTNTTATTASSQPTDDTTRGGLSLRSIIKKHEQISNAGGRVESEMESRSTVVHSHSTMSSDGKVTHKKNIIQGEISSKNGEAPVGKITQKTYTYQTPEDKQSLPTIKSTIKTSTIGQRRSSGPKIEEIKDESELQNIETNRRYSKEYTVEEEDSILNNNINRKKSTEDSSITKTYTSILKSTKDDEWNTTGGTTTVRKTSGPKLTEFPEDNVKSKVTRTTTTTTTKTLVSDNKDDNNKRPLGRGDSVKALQHKFQQATVSSTLKQSNVERSDSRGRIQQESKAREIITSSPVISTQVKTLEDSHIVKTSSPTTVTTRITTVTKGPVEEVTTTKVTEVSSKSGATSFLDDNTKVTGVQDILNRMRNADLVSESGDTSEDAEARALLNKFLGASVILQSMEQGMKAAQHSTTTTDAPSSAALVIQAEKQRVKDANIRTLEDDIDEICDEKQLRILLEACSDYEGRRKIRARLRTIMADHKESTDSSQTATKDGGESTKTEVHTARTTTTSTARLTKANSVQSPFAKFRQMERQNSAPRTYK